MGGASGDAHARAARNSAGCRREGAMPVARLIRYSPDERGCDGADGLRKSAEQGL